MFWIKKFLGHLIMPLPLGLALVTLGLLLIALRRRVRGWMALVLGWLVLVLAANRGVSIALTASLENTFPPVPALPNVADAAAKTAPQRAPAPLPDVEKPAPAATATAAPSVPPGVDPAPLAPPAQVPEALSGIGFVAVLGGGHGSATLLPAGQRLSPSARARLVEGLRIARALPDVWLVVSGPRDATDLASTDSHARVMANAAVELGFPRERIVEISTARDTAEETAALATLAGEDRVALVTSAWHLPRAMQLAEAANLRAFPCPADYLGGRDAAVPTIAWITWDSESLANTTRAWREYVGQAWAKLMRR